MTHVATIEDFLISFFKIFASKTFRGGDYLEYLNRPSEQRSGDEASIVDRAIVGPLLDLLGFAPAEQVYNQQRLNGRPDFAPADALYGTCFMVEDKSTSRELTFELDNPESNLSQLIGYMRSAGVSLGWLTNGKEFSVWQLGKGTDPTRIIKLDLPTAILEWHRHNPPALPPSLEKSLTDLWDLCRKAAFTDPERLEKKLAIEFEEWDFQALPLGTDRGHEATLVESLQTVVQELQRDAHRKLIDHLTRYAEYADKASRLSDGTPETASQQFKELRSRIKSVLINSFQRVWNLEDEDITAIEEILINLEQDARLFVSPKELLNDILDIINAAQQRKPPLKSSSKSKGVRPLSDLNDAAYTALQNPLQVYIDKGFAWHQRQATLRHEYQDALKVYDDYITWKSLVQETMLGSLDEEKRRDEFALQTSYVIFIRLLLIRVCEDKGVFPHRFLSDGGLKEWQGYIARYYIFASGNPYAPLLNMAYDNAQNIYAHFFTGRELFNWYQLDKDRFIMTLYQLSRFNFAGVDSDIIGTIYNTYVNREEKRNKGQYYTPPAIIHYILDTVGYRGRAIIGANKRLIDPACGSGSFLVEACRRLIQAYQGQIDDPAAVLDRIQQNVFGFDLNPFACYLAEINLLIQVLDLVKLAYAAKQPIKIERFHIYNVDALARPSGAYYYMNFHTLLAEENDLVNQIKSRVHHYAQGFAFVVANPPYGAKLSDTYKEMLHTNWSDVFYGQPDTYTFFLKLGMDLLANNGRVGFITPNTYLMGSNTANLRNKLLTAGRIEQIVDLPQGIWPDATVDCVLLFLAADADEAKRKGQQVQINLLNLNDGLDQLTGRAWAETLTQPQSRWQANPRNEITIRYDALLQQIEDACRIPINGGPATMVLRLGTVTESSQGIIPYKTQEEGKANAYIKPRREVPPTETDWKPLLDGDSFIGRYELRWDSKQPYLKYGNWLCRSRESKYFDSPKLLVQDMRNRSLKRRLVATFDDQKFYNRHNFSNIIAKGMTYDIKYILALLNSSLLNYWFARQFDNVHINPSYFRQLPIYPADPTTQQEIVALVDDILVKHAELSKIRTQGYTIKQQRDGRTLIEVPYDKLLQDLMIEDINYALFEIEMQQVAHITTLLGEIKRIDIQIDELVLDLYGITDPVDRQRILGSAPVEEEEMDGSPSEDL